MSNAKSAKVLFLWESMKMGGKFFILIFLQEAALEPLLVQGLVIQLLLCLKYFGIVYR